MKLAREHSATMARLNQLGHDLDGVTFADRVKASGYVSGGAVENVGEGYARLIDAVAGWMGSDAHRGNILSKNFTEVGVAIAAGEDGTRYWAQVFGTPRRWSH